MWLIIGYGNCLRSDDAVGFRLAEMLQTILPVQQADVLAVHQLTPELVEELIRPEVEQVLFIDVQRTQSEAFILTKLDHQVTVPSSTGHQQQPELLLHMARDLYGRVMAGWLLTIKGEKFSFGEKLSEATAAILPDALRFTQQFIKKRAVV